MRAKTGSATRSSTPPLPAFFAKRWEIHMHALMLVEEKGCSKAKEMRDVFVVGTVASLSDSVDSYEHIRAEEIRALVRNLFGCASHAVAVRECLVNATLRNILHMSVGEKWSGVYGSADGEVFRRTESSAVTMEWAMAELLRCPDAIATATDELDRVVGRARWVAESDLPDLPYVDAVVKGALRLHPVGPLLVPHHAMEDTVAACNDVPVGTHEKLEEFDKDQS
nr:cytochrome P450 98A8 [Oryza sativa Japonica Group]